ncbi:MAG: hypothetical protein K0U68_15375, partial [Gammaproteobacteria bacterium]|nr:hypothetical protein [Gammaproteobacteria bacterium]
EAGEHRRQAADQGLRCLSAASSQDPAECRGAQRTRRATDGAAFSLVHFFWPRKRNELAAVNHANLKTNVNSAAKPPQMPVPF